jgi:hypothetical protein
MALALPFWLAAFLTIKPRKIDRRTFVEGEGSETFLLFVKAWAATRHSDTWMSGISVILDSICTALKLDTMSLEA